MNSNVSFLSLPVSFAICLPTWYHYMYFAAADGQFSVTVWLMSIFLVWIGFDAHSEALLINKRSKVLLHCEFFWVLKRWFLGTLVPLAGRMDCYREWQIVFASSSQAGVKHVILAVSYRAELLEKRMNEEARRVSSHLFLTYPTFAVS